MELDTIIQKPNFTVDGRVWLNCENLAFSGPGKIELLLHIKSLGSLRKAAAAMKMSYRQAWQNIDKMNKLSGTPLVILKRGGKDGGTAEVTDYAQNVINTYKSLQSAFEVFLKEQSQKLTL